MLFVFSLLFLVMDYYIFQAVVLVSKDWPAVWKGLFRYGFWVPSALCFLAMLWWAFGDPYAHSSSFRNWIVTGIFTIYISKLFAVLFLFADDIQRGVRYLASLFPGMALRVCRGSPSPGLNSCRGRH